MITCKLCGFVLNRVHFVICLLSKWSTCFINLGQNIKVFIVNNDKYFKQPCMPSFDCINNWCHILRIYMFEWFPLRTKRYGIIIYICMTSEVMQFRNGNLCKYYNWTHCSCWYYSHIILRQNACMVNICCNWNVTS